MDHLRRLPAGAVHPPAPRPPLRPATAGRAGAARRLAPSIGAQCDEKRTEDPARAGGPSLRHDGGSGWRRARSRPWPPTGPPPLLHGAAAARQRLADTEDALGRVAAGVFGRCEQCGATVPEVLLAAAPELRYCATCARAASGSLTASTNATG